MRFLKGWCMNILTFYKFNFYVIFRTMVILFAK
jgi:hypothetical protein